MSKTKKLTREEAEEYTKNLGQVTVGNYGLMEFAMHNLGVPESLGMTNEEWVQERLGGYVRWGVEQRREAIRGLMQPDENGKTRPATKIAEILGISAVTVRRDMQVLQTASDLEITSAADNRAESGLEITSERKLTPKQKAKEIRRLIDLHRSNAEIAMEMGIGVSTVSKERTAYRKEAEAAREPSEKLKEAQRAKQEREKGKSDADKKAEEAESDAFAQQMQANLQTAFGISPTPHLQEAVVTMQQVMDADSDFDFERALGLWAKLGDELWLYGAKRGLDVSLIAKVIDRMKGGESE
jgi:hypothetical protein